jgi:hypothetical protein
MTDREAIEKNPTAYLILGDVDKDFHLPECECNWCEDWRKSKDRPTRKELRERSEPNG